MVFFVVFLLSVMYSLYSCVFSLPCPLLHHQAPKEPTYEELKRMYQQGTLSQNVSSRGSGGFLSHFVLIHGTYNEGIVMAVYFVVD